MEVYWNPQHTEYAILVSRGFGAGWSTWNGKELAYDKRVIEWYLEHNYSDFFNKVRLYSPETLEHKEATEFFNSLGYGSPYFGGLQLNMIEWVPAGKRWRIDEYDGSESIHFANDDDWIIFNNG